MKLFKRKNSLKTRIRSLESFLGVFYAEDSWGDLEHKAEADGYSVLQSLQKDVKALQAETTLAKVTKETKCQHTQ